MEITLDLESSLALLVEQAVSRALAAQEAPRGWLTVGQSAVHLGLSEASLRSMRQRGEGPTATTFPNGRIRFSIADLDDWARSA